MADKDSSSQSQVTRKLEASEARKSFDTLIAVKPAISTQSLQSLANLKPTENNSTSTK